MKSYFAFVTLVSLHRRRQRLVERFFGMNMTKTQLTHFLTSGTKNMHCADPICRILSDTVTYTPVFVKVTA